MIKHPTLKKLLRDPSDFRYDEEEWAEAEAWEEEQKARSEEEQRAKWEYEMEQAKEREMERSWREIIIND